MIYNDLTPLEDKIESIARELFLEWKIAVSVDFPELFIDLKDENKIITDFKEIVDEAITEIVKEQEKLNSLIAKYSYFQGFVQKNLNKRWHFNYILKQTNEFKILTLLWTIDDYLNEESYITNKIRDLYNENILDGINFTNFDSAISAMNDEILMEMECPEQKSSQEIKKNPVIMGIKNIIAKIENDINQQYEIKMYISEDIYEFFFIKDFEALINLNLPK